MLGIIVPVGPGDPCPVDLINRLSASPAEIRLVVSATRPRPRLLGHHDLAWIQGRPGRGRQLNRARAMLPADWLWFVHADCRVDAETIRAVIRFTKQTPIALGYCRLRFLDDGPALVRLNAMGANLRSRLFGLPYGDQSLLVPSSWFDRLDGFREDLERGEDLDFVVRARTAGLPARPVGATIYTSARRYRDNGWLRTTWQHQLAARRLIRDARGRTPSSSP